MIPFRDRLGRRLRVPTPSDRTNLRAKLVSVYIGVVCIIALALFFTDLPEWGGRVVMLVLVFHMGLLYRFGYWRNRRHG